tara:strand:- start:14401 stop:15135 length:735 start_codon:yes stop_codon:yes gene_type:complete
MTKQKLFNPFWAILLTWLIFNLTPIPFIWLLDFFGNWVYTNPIESEINILGGNLIFYPIRDNLLTFLSTPLMIFLIYLISKRRNLNFGHYLGKSSPSFYTYLKWSFLLFILLVVEEVYLYLVKAKIPQSFLDFIIAEPLIFGFMSVVIFAPIVEEFLFRGFLFEQLKDSFFGIRGSILVSSFLWTSLHLQYEWKILIFLFFFGLFLGYVRWKKDSLMLVIFLHFINNLIAFCMVYFDFSFLELF